MLNNRKKEEEKRVGKNMRHQLLSVFCNTMSLKGEGYHLLEVF